MRSSGLNSGKGLSELDETLPPDQLTKLRRVRYKQYRSEVVTRCENIGSPARPHSEMSSLANELSHHSLQATVLTVPVASNRRSRELLFPIRVSPMLVFFFYNSKTKMANSVHSEFGPVWHSHFYHKKNRCCLAQSFLS